VSVFRALRANPNVAVTIDRETFPPEVLTLRGRVEISAVDGVPPVAAPLRNACNPPSKARAAFLDKQPV
jgi:hypothetical protein